MLSEHYHGSKARSLKEGVGAGLSLSNVALTLLDMDSESERASSDWSHESRETE